WSIGLVCVAFWYSRPCRAPVLGVTTARATGMPRRSAVEHRGFHYIAERDRAHPAAAAWAPTPTTLSEIRRALLAFFGVALETAEALRVVLRVQLLLDQ